MPSGAARVYQVPDSSSESGHSEDESIVVKTANHLKAAIHKRNDTGHDSVTSAPVLRSTTPVSRSTTPIADRGSSDNKEAYESVKPKKVSPDNSFSLTESIAKEMSEVLDRTERRRDTEPSTRDDLTLIHPSRRENHLRKRIIEDDEDDMIQDTYEHEEEDCDNQYDDSDEASNVQRRLSASSAFSKASTDAPEETTHSISNYSIYDSDRDSNISFKPIVQKNEVAEGNFLSSEDEPEFTSTGKSATRAYSGNAIKTPFFSFDTGIQASIQTTSNVYDKPEEPKTNGHGTTIAQNHDHYHDHDYDHHHTGKASDAYSPYPSFSAPSYFRYSPARPYEPFGYGSASRTSPYRCYDPFSQPLQSSYLPQPTSSHTLHTYNRPAASSQAWFGDNMHASSRWNNTSPQYGPTTSASPRYESASPKPVNLNKASISHILDPTAQSHPDTSAVEQQGKERSPITASSQFTQASKATLSSTDSIDLDWAALDHARKELDNATAKVEVEASSIKSGAGKLPVTSYLSDASVSETQSLRTLSEAVQPKGVKTGWFSSKPMEEAEFPPEKGFSANKPFPEAFDEARGAVEHNDDSSDDSSDDSQASSPRPAKRLRFASPTSSEPTPKRRDFRPTTYATKPLQQTSIDDTFRPLFKAATSTFTASNSTTTPTPTTTTIPTPPTTPAQIAATARRIAAENSNQRITRSRATVAAAKSQEKRGGNGFAKKIAPFMLGALAGGVGVLGALVALPERYF